MTQTRKSFALLVVLISILLMAISACEPSGSALPTATSAPSIPAGDGYPAGTDDAGYPLPTREGLSENPPDPARDLPAAPADFSVVGGVTVREISNEGFVPLNPVEVILAEVKTLSSGEPGLLALSDESPRATLPGTGIFIFNNVPPGQYGIIIEMGFTQLPGVDQNGVIIVFEVAAGQALDIGQVFVSFD